MTGEHRKIQLREAQRRRREKLSSGERSQVSLFLTQQSKKLLDKWCLEYKTNRHDLVNSMILLYSTMPERISMAISK